MTACALLRAGAASAVAVAAEYAGKHAHAFGVARQARSGGGGDRRGTWPQTLCVRRHLPAARRPIRLGCGGGGAEGTPSCVSAGATGSGGVCSGCDGETPTCGMPICDCIADGGAAASAVSAPPFSAGATEAAGAGLRAAPEAAGAFALAAVPIRSVRMVNCFPPRVTLRVCSGGAAVSCGGASSWRTMRTRNSDTRHWRAISRLLHACHSGSASISSIACRRSMSVRRWPWVSFAPSAWSSAARWPPGWMVAAMLSRPACLAASIR